MNSRGAVSSIVATGVLGQFDYHVSYDSDESERLKLIYAPNGRGKTNFLKATENLLDQSFEALHQLTEAPLSGLTIEFDSGAYLSMQRDDAFAYPYTMTASMPGLGEGPVNLTIDPSYFTGRASQQVLEGREDFLQFRNVVESILRPALMIGDDRLSSRSDSLAETAKTSAHSIRRRREQGTVSRLLDKVERELSYRVFAGMSATRRRDGVYSQITRATLEGSQDLSTVEARGELEEKIDALLSVGRGFEVYGLISLDEVRDIREQLSAARRNAQQLPMLHRIIKPYLDNIQDRIESVTDAFKKIDAFVSGVNKFLDRKILTFSATSGIRLLGHDGADIPPDSLSSGERHLIYLMSQATLASSDGKLLIIDEPELSLGINWQRMLLRELLECTKNSEVLFLIASHSLQVMNGIPVEDIVQPVESGS